MVAVPWGWLCGCVCVCEWIEQGNPKCFLWEEHGLCSLKGNYVKE